EHQANNQPGSPPCHCSGRVRWRNFSIAVTPSNAYIRFRQAACVNCATARAFCRVSLSPGMGRNYNRPIIPDSGLFNLPGRLLLRAEAFPPVAREARAGKRPAPLRNRHAEPVALGLGGEERLEDSLPLLGRQPRAVVRTATCTAGPRPDLFPHTG